MSSRTLMNGQLPAPARPLAKALINAYGAYHAHQYFSWLIDSVLVDFGLPRPEPVPEQAQATVHELVHLYAQAVVDTEPFEDILGNVYMELASHGSKKWLGQFFTPMGIARMMGTITLGERDGSDGTLVRVIDPACGSAVMLLGAIQHLLTSKGPEELLHWSFTGIDLDRTCARMAAAQLMANAAVHQAPLGEVFVAQGDSLRPDQGLQVVIHASGPGVGLEHLLPVGSAAVQQMIRNASLASGHPDLTPETEMAEVEP